MLSDKLGHQTGAIQQLLQDFLQRLDFSAVILAIREQLSETKVAMSEQGGQVTSKLKSMQQQLQQLELGLASRGQRSAVEDTDITQILAAVREGGRTAGPPILDLTEVLDAVKAIPGQVDLSYEFSAVLTAIQDKQSDVDLPTMRSLVTGRALG